MLGRGAHRRLRIGRSRGCRGDGWAPAGSRSWVGARGARRFPPWPASARRALARAHRRREGAAPACPLAPRALRGPPALGAPPSASVTAPRTCGRQLAAPLPRLAARWAAGTPPPPTRARAEVRATGGQGHGDADAGRVGRSAGRAVSAREAKGEEEGRKGVGTRGGRACSRLSLSAFPGLEQFARF